MHSFVLVSWWFFLSLLCLLISILFLFSLSLSPIFGVMSFVQFFFCYKIQIIFSWIISINTKRDRALYFKLSILNENSEVATPFERKCYKIVYNVVVVLLSILAFASFCAALWAQHKSVKIEKHNIFRRKEIVWELP